MSIYRKLYKKEKTRSAELNEEVAGLDRANQEIIRRCLELELENWRLKREIQRANPESGAPVPTENPTTVGDVGLPRGRSRRLEEGIDSLACDSRGKSR
jgi:hypothetical protein